MKLEWHPIDTLDEATELEQLRGLWFYDSDFHFYSVCKGWWNVPRSITHWAYGDKPNTPAAARHASPVAPPATQAPVARGDL